MAKASMIFGMALGILFSTTSIAGDPFVRKQASVSHENGGSPVVALKLQGVKIDAKGKRNALINGEWYRTGQVLEDGNKVISITSKNVKFDNHGVETVIYIDGDVK